MVYALEPQIARIPDFETLTFWGSGYIKDIINSFDI